MGLEETVSSLLVGISGQREEQKNWFQDSPASRGKGPRLLHKQVLPAARFGMFTRSVGKTRCFPLTEYSLLSSVHAHVRSFWQCIQHGRALAHPFPILFWAGSCGKNMRPRDPDLWMWETIIACSLRHRSFPLIFLQNPLKLSDALYRRQLLLITTC